MAIIDSPLREWARQEIAGNGSILADWKTWLETVFPEYISDKFGNLIPFGPHHVEMWEWVWAIEAGMRPRPFVAIWPRGGAKSTTAELACVAVAARKTRRYGLYVSETQSQADDHVTNVATMLESRKLEAFHPELSERLLSKYGQSKGWRRNRIRTASFTLDAIGLDVAARGAKLDEDRPDWFILDDLDGEADTPDIVGKKISTLTKGIIPAGAEGTAFLAIQNLVHSRSIFARLAGVAEEKADFLADRTVSGPIPAVRDLAVDEVDGAWKIVSGTPSWEGQNIERCQEQIAEWGLTAFMTEAQHDVEVRPGGMYDHITFRHIEWADLPDLVRIVVWVDPAVTDNDDSDSNGIQADGIDADGNLYRLWSWEQRSSSEATLRMAIRKAIELGADHVGVETDQGGDLWETSYRDAARETAREIQADTGVRPRVPPFMAAKAGQGHGPKKHRQSQVIVDYERGKIWHVIGTHMTLERALKRFPKSKPLDLADAGYWSWADLTGRLDDEPKISPMPGLVMPMAASGGWSSRAKRGRFGRV